MNATALGITDPTDTRATQINHTAFWGFGFGDAGVG